MYKVREPRPSDLNFIFDSFLMSYKGSPGVENMDVDDYFKSHRALLTRLLETASVDVACAEADDDLILGWVAYVEHTLIYVNVKKDVRGHGIARALVPPFIRDYVFHSKQVRKVPQGWKHRPDYLFR